MQGFATKRHRFLAIFGVLIGSLAMGMSFSLINTNLESINEHFGASILELQWMINTYGIFIASSLVAAGRIADMYGRKRMYLVGCILFGIAMLGSGIAPSPGYIILFMVFYGLAGGLFLPISQALLVHIYPDGEKNKAIGLWTATGGIGLAIGPIFGGALLTLMNWRWMFLSSVPLSLISFGLVYRYARESRSEDEAPTVDWLGTAFLFIAIATFVLALTQSNEWPIHIILPIFGVSLCSLICLLIVEKKVRMPIIREELFTNKMFLLCSVVTFCMIAAFWAAIFLIPLFVQKNLGYTPLQAGFMMLCFSLPVGLLSIPASRLYARIGPKPMILAGTVFMAISSGMQLTFSHQTGFVYVAIATLILSMGFAAIWAPATTAAVSTLSRKDAGLAAGTFVTIQEIGGNVGLAATVTVVRYFSDFTDGFHHGMWVMIGNSAIAITAALFIRNRLAGTLNGNRSSH